MKENRSHPRWHRKRQSNLCNNQLIMEKMSWPDPWLFADVKEAKRSSSLGPSTIRAPRFHWSRGADKCLG
jgi:hypothetical protein